MARSKKGFSRRRIGVIIVGVILLIFLTNSVLTGGQDLTLANPFGDHFNYLSLEPAFPLFDITGAQINLSTYIEPDAFGGFNFFCTLKLKTQVTFDDGTKIFLDSPAQIFSPLVSFDLLSAGQGRAISVFDTQPLMTCPVLNAKDLANTSLDESTLGVLMQGRLPYKVTSTNFFMNVYSWDEDGVRTLVKGGLTLPLKLDGSNQGAVEPIDFVDNPNIDDPVKIFFGCTNNCGLFIGNERIIGNNIKISADQIENALNPTGDFDTRVEFRAGGQVQVEIPYLTQVLGERFLVNIPINQATLINSFDFTVDTEQTVTVGGANLKNEITSMIIANEQKNTIQLDGSVTSELIRVFISVNNWDQSEGRPTCQAISSQVVQPIFTKFSISASEESLARGSDGVNSFFECRLRMPNNAPIGTYEVQAFTNAEDRAKGTTTLEATRNTSLTCEAGQERNLEGNCVNEFGGGCEDDEFRTSAGDCIKIGTRACFDCLDRQVRTVAEGQLCPEFQCNDGRTVGGDTGVAFCPDGSPPDKIAGAETCDRSIRDGLSFLPTLVDCEGENRTADPEAGEICVPSIVFFFANNAVGILIAVIILIIIIAIISAIVKRSPAGIISRGFRV